MTRRYDVWVRSARWIGRLAAMLVFAAGVVVLMLWLAGKFEPKVPVGSGGSARADGGSQRRGRSRARPQAAVV